MWITVATLSQNMDTTQATQLLMESSNVRSDILAEGVETAGYLLPPHDTQAAAMAAFVPGGVFRRAWSLESSARRSAEFVNNHSSRQMTVVVEQQDI